MRTLKVLAGMLGAIAGSVLGVGAVIARRVTAPPARRNFDLAIHRVEQDGGSVTLVVDRTRQSIAEGKYCILFEHGGWAQLSEEVLDRGPHRVARRVTKLSPGHVPAPGDRVSWSGIYFMTPTDADLVAEEVWLSTTVGAAPAWLIEGAGEGAATWAIHIHGLGSPRSGPLRGARVATALGCTSLVVSYRNDGDGPVTGAGRSMLGAAEVDDVDAAMKFALDRGAQRIVLFGWSMGAAIVLQLATRAAYRQYISAVVLESPVLDWVATIKANCVRAGLPAVAGLLAVPWLTFRPLARAIGLAGPIPLRMLNWIVRAGELTAPILVLHGTRDDSAPSSVARALADLRPDLVRLEEFDAGHTMTWNSDPDRWQTIVSAWLNPRIAHS